VIAMEGGPLLWVATHRTHHQFPDREGDPHTPLDGKWWAHVGWILVGNAMRHDASTLDRYVPDLIEDKFHVWMTEFHFLPTVVLGLALFAIGGLPFLLWGIFLAHRFWDSMRPGSSIRRHTFGVRGALRPGIYRPTVGGWLC